MKIGFALEQGVQQLLTEQYNYQTLQAMMVQTQQMMASVGAVYNPLMHQDNNSNQKQISAQPIIRVHFKGLRMLYVLL